MVVQEIDDPSEPGADRAAPSALKVFRPAGRGPWADVSDGDWNDWHWQLRHRISTLEQLEYHLPSLTPTEREGARLANRKLALGITPYFFNLIQPDNPDCPIRRQVVPREEELLTAPWESLDPCGEQAHSPLPGLVHRYPDRVLLLVSDRCASYCRYCTRSRLVSPAAAPSLGLKLEPALEYLERHTEVRDVLLSGGDPLLLSDDRLEAILSALRQLPHLEFLRIGTRVPIVLPQRITPALSGLLRRHQPLFVSIHTNHPRELTLEARAALGQLADAGVPLGNQSVLLRGVNDDEHVMQALVEKLLLCRVKPYYLYQCDLIAGSAHLRTSVRRGLALVQALRGHTSGYAIPQYVIDTPGGGGKVPINPDTIASHNADRVVFRNFEGRLFEYPEMGDPAPGVP